MTLRARVMLDRLLRVAVKTRSAAALPDPGSWLDGRSEIRVAPNPGRASLPPGSPRSGQCEGLGGVLYRTLLVTQIPAKTLHR